MASGITRLNRVRWHIFDAAEEPVGRMATKISTLLQGKHKPTYSPHLDHGDNVIVINAKNLVFTGRKMENKLYRWHTGFPGGLRSTTPKQLIENKNQPERVIEKAVNGMLPKNNLRRARMKRLKIFPDENHPFDEILKAQERS